MGEDSPGAGGLKPGSVMAGYRIESRTGSGGMAVVYRARDERLGRLVALKVMSARWTGDEEFRQRFLAESRAAAAVDHPHVIPVYEAGEADGDLFIAMRLVSGSDLRETARREGAMAPARALDLLSPVASALEAAHAAGLVHRDVKPANILIDLGDGRPDHVYLSDFGLSKGAASGTSLTSAGRYLGTPRFSAPEQVRGDPVDGRTDEYALACVACLLLTGQVPFDRDDSLAILFAHVNEAPPSLLARRPDLPAAVDSVMARALAKEPADRYPACQDFTEALRAALGLPSYASPGTAFRSTPRETAPQPPPVAGEGGTPRAWRWTRGRLTVIAAACAALAAAIIIPLTWPSAPTMTTSPAAVSKPARSAPAASKPRPFAFKPARSAAVSGPGQSASGPGRPAAVSRPGRFAMVPNPIPGPAGWWKLDDGVNAAATTAADSSPGGHPAAGRNVTWCSGPGCARFDGANSAFTTSGPVLNTGPGSGFTVSAWVWLRDIPANGAFATAVSQDGNGASGFFLQYSGQDKCWAFSRVKRGTVPDRALGCGVPLTQTWTHLTGVFDASGNRLRLYVNGTLRGTALDTAPNVSGGPLAIGRAQYAGKPADWFPGSIKQVEVFGQALTGAQVRALYRQ